MTPLNQATAQSIQTRLWNNYPAWVERELGDDHARGEVTVNGVSMRYACFFHGQQPEAGWSLYDSTSQVQEGLYCAPRSLIHVFIGLRIGCPQVGIE